MSLYLSPADVTRTTGRTRFVAQCRALDAMGIRYLRGRRVSEVTPLRRKG